MATFGEIDKLSTGASVTVKGVVKESPGKGQKYVTPAMLANLE